MGARDSFRANRPSAGRDTSRSSAVGRLKVPKAVSRAMINPEFPGRCAWPFQLLSCLRPYLLPPALAHRTGEEQPLLVANRAPRTHLAAAFYQIRGEQPDRRFLTSSSAGCNKKKPPTARSATRRTRGDAHTRVKYWRACIRIYARITARARARSRRLLPRPGTTLRTSNEIKFKYNQIKFKI